MKNSHYYPHSGGILGCHPYVDFQQTNYLLNVTICEKLRCAHKLQTISDAFSHIASRFLKVVLAIKFALNWLAGPQCAGLIGMGEALFDVFRPREDDGACKRAASLRRRPRVGRRERGGGAARHARSRADHAPRADPVSGDGIFTCRGRYLCGVYEYLGALFCLPI